MTKKHVLLIYPSTEKDNPGFDSEFAQGWKNLPIGILSIGSYIKEKGYDVTILDFRRYEKKDVLSRIDSSIKENTICIGLSMMTMQIGHGLEIIDYVRSKHSKQDIPIVVGGIHATMFPDQIMGEKNIDYAILGEGEKSFHSLLQRIEHKKTDLSKIDGLGYKKGGKTFVNQMGAALSVEELSFPNYDLMEDIELYIGRNFFNADGTSFKIRCMDLHTSRGCPYQCTYCINTIAYSKKWRTKNIEDILAHIDFVIKKYDLDFIWFMDDFFFGDVKRVRTIAEHIIKKKYKIRWEATIRANLFREGMVDDELLPILKKSGCYSLGMGFESGSERILKKIKKAITIDNIVHAVEQCKKYGIMPRGSFMCGIPTETKEEVMQTGHLVLRLKKIHPQGIYYSPGLLRPYPGAELYDECLTYGLTEPKSLRDWSRKNFDFGMYMHHTDLKWITHPRWLTNYQIYLHLASLRLSAKLLKKKQSLPYYLFGTISLWRVEHDFLYLPIEPTILIFARKVILSVKKKFNLDF